MLAGVSQAAVAVELGRPRCTVSREIAWNRDPDGGGYRPFAAQQRAERRRARPKTPKLAGNPVLRDLVRDLLACRHSLAQISAGSAAEADDQRGIAQPPALTVQRHRVMASLPTSSPRNVTCRLAGNGPS
nr:hypothetical protein GCM10020063_088050 [Dactylosporangium thailandense]